MKKLKILLLILACIHFAHAQRKFKYPKTAFGAELSLGKYTFVQQSDGSGGYNTNGVNIVLRGLYEYNPKQWLGLSSGLGFDLRRYTEYGYGEPPHTILALQIPLMAQLRLGRSFGFEFGGDVNFLLLNKREKEVIEGKAYPVDLVGYGGFRIRLYKGLSIGTGIRWGLTPLYSQVIYSNVPTTITGTHRGVTFSLKYMFY